MFLVTISAGRCAAQPPSRPSIRAYDRPAISPYLNLLDRNRSFEENYFLRVRPQLEFQRADAQLRQGLGTVNRRLDEQQRQMQSTKSALGPSGHTTSFLSYGSYYSFGR
jgi:hypothetical protein